MGSSNSVSMAENVIEHVLQPTDTLAGIALKYGVTKETLKRYNGIHSDMLLAAETKILVPLDNPKGRKPQTDEQRQRALVKQFASEQKCTQFEAKTYLSECNYNMEEAIEKRNVAMKPKTESDFNPTPKLDPHKDFDRPKQISVKKKKQMEA